jgi:methionyl-tRNA formyltransferase
VTEPLERPVRTIFLGSGRFGDPTLGALARHPSVRLVAVVTAPPRPVGRRQLVTPTPIETEARRLGIPVRSPERLRAPDAIADVMSLDPELVVLADYGQIVPEELLGVRHGALNLHPSLLPRHRGATPIPAAILARDTETGVTLFRMDPGIDTGPIVASERSTLGPEDTAPAVEARLAIIAAGLLVRALDPWLDGQTPPVPQSEEGATITRPLHRSDGLLDPATPAVVLARQIRAYQPWPGSFLNLESERVVVLAGRPTPSARDDEPGRLVADGAGLALTTVDGRLVLGEVQPAGGRPMSGDAFLRGRPSIVGSAVVALPGGDDRPQGQADGVGDRPNDPA